MSPEPVRVAIYAWMDPENPNGGGDVRFLYEIASRLTRDGVEVTWISSRIAGKPDQSELNRIRVLRTGSIYSVFLKHYLDLRTRPLRKSSITIENVSSIPFFLPPRRGSTRVALVHHLVPFRQSAQRVGLLAPLVYLVERVLTPSIYHTRLVAAPSRATERELRSLGYRNVSVSMQGTDPHEVELASKQPIVVCPGPVKPWKHHLAAMEAFSKMPDTWKLVVFGHYDPPTLEERLRNRARELGIVERVSLLGRISDEARDKLLQRASLCLIASEKEGWCLAASEAQASGCPVVAYSSGGLDENVQDQVTGRLVRPGDLIALSRSLVELASNGPLRDAMARRALARSRVASWERVYRDFTTRFLGIAN